MTDETRRPYRVRLTTRRTRHYTILATSPESAVFQANNGTVAPDKEEVSETTYRVEEADTP